jgi:hypothetical protein
VTSLAYGGRIKYQSTKYKPTLLQEDVMNKKQMILAALMIVVITGLSQAQTFYPALKGYSAEAKEQMDLAYASLLKSQNNHYIENALATVTMIQLDLPADKFPMIQNRIDTIAAHAATPTIQYRASLAKAVFANTAFFKEEAACHYKTTDAFFSAVAERAVKLNEYSLNYRSLKENNEK